MNRKRLTQVIGMSLLIVLLTALIAGCGGSSSSSSSSGDSTEASGGTTGGSEAGGGDSSAVAEAQKIATEAEKVPTKILQTVPLNEKPPTDITIASLYENNPGNTLTAEGVEEAAKPLGWKYLKIQYNNAEPASFQAAVKTALSKGADYMEATGTPPSVLGPSVLKEIEAAGAKLIVSSTYPEENSNAVSTEGAVGQIPAGRLLANWFIADSDGEGTALISNVAAYPVLHQFAVEFQKEAKAKCSGCTVEIAEFSKSDLEKGAIIPTLVNKMRSNSDIGYVLFDYSAFAVGIESAMAAAGIENVKIGGTGPEPESFEALRKGTQAAWTGSSWKYQAYTDVDLAARFATESEGGENDSDQPIMLMTPESINQKGIFDESGNFNAPLDALEQFEKLWKVG